MPHADRSLVPAEITTKAEFYAHIHQSLLSLLEGSRYWVSNLAQTSSLLYHSYLSSPLYGLDPSHPHTPMINWVGFYVHPPSGSDLTHSGNAGPQPLILAPYNGRPACISVNPVAGRGVCADAFVSGRGLIVPDVHTYPGHIACDSETKSEIVIPLRSLTSSNPIGVLDLDSTVLRTFDDDDLAGLQRLMEILEEACDWT